MSERQLDDAIDRAVRDMMDVDADAAFRARVFERLEQSKPARFGWRWLALAGGATLMLALIVMVRTPNRPPASGSHEPAKTFAAAPPTVRPEPAQPIADVRAAGTQPSTTRSPRTHRAVRAAAQLRPGLMVATVAPAEPAVWIPPLDVIEPITVAPLDAPRIMAEDIVVAPLDPIAEMQIAPLSPRVERD